jgi:hypothetical protein
MDSPGLFAPNRAAIFDSQLLAILNLLSSVVIYNSMNIIDRSAIEKLSYAVETGECARLIQSSVRITLTGLAFQHLQ